MATFREISRREEKTVITTVEFDIEGEKLTVDIPHFMPKDEEEIREGIRNRMITEERNLQNNS